jgi:DNA-directed RNA polymerase specialized sigma24 family protein
MLSSGVLTGAEGGPTIALGSRELDSPALCEPVDASATVRTTACEHGALAACTSLFSVDGDCLHRAGARSEAKPQSRNAEPVPASATLPTPADDVVRRARAGDRAAEEALFAHLSARLHALAKKRIWDEDAARDIAQETLRTAYEKFREADLSRGLFPWVFAIMHNKVGNYLKSRRAAIARGAVGDPSLAWDTIGPVAAEVAGAVEIADSLERGLRSASPECRAIFRLLLSGATRSDFAAHFPGQKPGTIDSRISRCRGKLLRYLEALWKEELA